MLGGLCFTAASWHQKARDDYIGWTADARVSRLHEIVNNHRFLILPGVRVWGLASWVLREGVDALARDWPEHHGAAPQLVYTYVDPRWPGGSYRAAGWKLLASRTSGSPPGAKGPPAPRRVFVKPMASEWKSRLCGVPPRRMGHRGTLFIPPGADWAEVEYSRGTHPDGRVQRRIRRMGRAWLNRPGASVPAIFPKLAEQRAAYRLLSSGNESPDHILAAHQEAMVDRCRPERTILAVQDTTTLNYGTLESASGLDRIARNQHAETRGLQVHAGLALTTAGRPLGVFDLQSGYRGKLPSESERWLQGLRRAQELGDACPDTRVISVCDREGDFFDLFRSDGRDRQGLLVRANASHKRKIAVDDGERELWEWMKDRPSRDARRFSLARASPGVPTLGRIDGSGLEPGRHGLRAPRPQLRAELHIGPRESSLGDPVVDRALGHPQHLFEVRDPEDAGLDAAAGRREGGVVRGHARIPSASGNWHFHIHGFHGVATIPACRNGRKC